MHAHQVNNNHQVQNANQDGLPNIWTKPNDENEAHPPGPPSPKRKETNHIQHRHTHTAGCEALRFLMTRENNHTLQHPALLISFYFNESD